MSTYNIQVKSNNFIFHILYQYPRNEKVGGKYVKSGVSCKNYMKNKFSIYSISQQFSIQMKLNQTGILLFLWIEIIQASIIFEDPYYISSTGTPWIMSSWNMNSQQFMLFLTKNTSSASGAVLVGQNNSFDIKEKNITYNNSLQLRMFSAISNITFLIFTPQKIKIYSFDSMNNPYTYTAFGSNSIKDACFAQNKTKYFLLQQDTLLNKYIIKMNNGNLTVSFNLPNASLLYLHDKMIFLDGILYVSFQTTIEIYSANILLLTHLHTITYENTSTNFTDMAVDSEYLCYSVNKQITLLHIGNWSLFWVMDFTENIIGVTLVDMFVIATTPTKIYQIDYHLRAIINSTSVKKGSYLNNPVHFEVGYYQPRKSLILFFRYPYINMHYYVYSFDPKYDSPTNSCFPSYYYSNNKCIKNTSYVFTSLPYFDGNLTSNITNNTEFHDNQTDIIDDMQQSENETNLTNITTQGTSKIKQKQKDQLQYLGKDIIDALNSSAMKPVYGLLGKSLVFTSMRISPTFLLSFTGLLDDLWFYKYHRTQYPLPIQFFMQEVDFMSDLRLSPWFLEQFINQEPACNTSNTEFYENMNFTGNDPNDVYFLYSGYDTYKDNLLMNILFLFIFKIIYFGLKKLRNVLLEWKRNCEQNQENKEGKNESQGVNMEKEANYYQFLKIIVSFLEHNSNWWLIFNAVLQSNMLKLTFNCFIQLLLPSHFSTFDKLNLMVTLTFLLLLLLYCLCYYPLIFTYSCEADSEVLLVKSKFMFRSFYFECVCIVFRNFIRSLVHSLFISCYSIQISLLAFIDFVFLVATIKLWCCFENRVIALLSILYLFTFFLFDLFFSLKENINNSVIQNMNKNAYSFVLVLILSSTATLICIALLIEVLAEVFKFLYLKLKYFCPNENKTKQDEQIFPQNIFNIGVLVSQYSISLHSKSALRTLKLSKGSIYPLNIKANNEIEDKISEHFIPNTFLYETPSSKPIIQAIQNADQGKVFPKTQKRIAFQVQRKNTYYQRSSQQNNTIQPNLNIDSLTKKSSKTISRIKNSQTQHKTKTIRFESTHPIQFQQIE